MDAEQDFGYRVGADRQKRPGRKTGIADNRQHRYLGRPEAEQVGAAVTEEEPARWVVYQEETEGSANAGKRQQGGPAVACLPGEQPDPSKHEDGGATSNPMKPVDDIDRLCD